jgi:hypothetical protein
MRVYFEMKTPSQYDYAMIPARQEATTSAKKKIHKYKHVLRLWQRHTFMRIKRCAQWLQWLRIM